MGSERTSEGAREKDEFIVGSISDSAMFSYMGRRTFSVIQLDLINKHDRFFCTCVNGIEHELSSIAGKFPIRSNPIERIVQLVSRTNNHFRNEWQDQRTKRERR